jgi:hypothetical protein
VSDGTVGGQGVHEVDGPPAPDRAASPEPTVAHPRPGGEPAAGGGAGDNPYDAEFFTAIDPESYASARAVVPRVLGLTGARSIIDVGSGSGAWIRACRDLGVPEVVGLDAAYVPDAHREVATEFIESDLTRPLGLDRQFNLVLCLEVAEHLPPERAPGLVADLTSLAPVVLFSAAVPGQGGTGHLNEQWSEYWVALFEAHGWTCRDAVRPWVRTNEQVAWWYRQNLFLAVAPSADTAYGSFPKLDSIRIPNPVDYLRRPDGDEMRPPGAVPDVEGAEPGTPESGVPAMAGPAVPAETGGGDAAAASPADEGPDAGPDETPAEAPTAAGSPPPDAGLPATGATSDEPEATEPTAAGHESDDRARRDADNAEFWGTGEAAAPTAADEVDHPRPPGWDALKRMSRRVRRRGGDS